MPDTDSPSKYRGSFSFFPSSFFTSTFFLLSTSSSEMLISALAPNPRKLWRGGVAGGGTGAKEKGGGEEGGEEEWRGKGREGDGRGCIIYDEATVMAASLGHVTPQQVLSGSQVESAQPTPPPTTQPTHMHSAHHLTETCSSRSQRSTLATPPVLLQS